LSLPGSLSSNPTVRAASSTLMYPSPWSTL